MAGEASYDKILLAAFGSSDFREEFVRKMDVPALLSAGSERDSQEVCTKRRAFVMLLPGGHLEELRQVIRQSSSIESVNDQFLTRVDRGVLGTSKLDELVAWMDVHQPKLAKLLRDSSDVIKKSANALKVPSSASLFPCMPQPTERTLCQRCIDILGPRLDGNDDWQKLYAAMGKTVCPPARRAAVAACPDGKTSTIIKAWCRVTARSEATLSQLIRILYSQRLYGAIASLAEGLSIQGESRAIRDIINEAEEKSNTATSPVLSQDSGSMSGGSHAEQELAVPRQAVPQQAVPQQESRVPLAWDQSIGDVDHMLDSPKFAAMLDALEGTYGGETSAAVLYRYLCKNLLIQPLAEVHEHRPGFAKIVMQRWLMQSDRSLLLSRVREMLNSAGLDAACRALEAAFSIPGWAMPALHSGDSSIIMDESIAQ